MCQWRENNITGLKDANGNDIITTPGCFAVCPDKSGQTPDVIGPLPVTVANDPQPVDDNDNNIDINNENSLLDNDGAIPILITVGSVLLFVVIFVLFIWNKNKNSGYVNKYKGDLINSIVGA